MITKMHQSALAPPPMSGLRKMSPKILNSRKSQAIQRKKTNIVQIAPSSG